METKDVILQIDEFKTFVPSYEKPLEEEQIEPSTGQKIIEKAVTAAVWTGVLLTLPVSYFWVFKKASENEEILVRRMGRILPSVRRGSTIAKLPIIDQEVRIDTSLRKTIVPDKEVCTFDKCLILVGGEVEWRVAEPQKAFASSVDFEKIATDEFACQIRKNISKSFIREIATEKDKVERKILGYIQTSMYKIGVKVQSLKLSITPSTRQPFLNPGGIAEVGNGEIGGIGGAIEKANTSTTHDMIADAVAGLSKHPGFSNIISSMVQTVGDIHKANLDQDESSALNEPTKQDIVETLKRKGIVLGGSERVLLKLSDGDVEISSRGVQICTSTSNSLTPDCTLTIKNSDILKILTGKISYRSAFANGLISVDGEVLLLRKFLNFI